MPWFDAYTLEGGALQGFFDNGAGSDPSTIEVEAGGMAGSPFNVHWGFSANDNHGRLTSASFTRAAAGTAILAHGRTIIDDLANLDERSIYFRAEGSTTPGYVGFTIEGNGAITPRSGFNGGNTFDANPALGAASAAGLIQDGVEFSWVMRVVVGNGTAGEIQIAVDNAEIVNVTGVDTMGGSGTILTTWDLNWYFSTTPTLTTDIRMAVIVLGRDMALDAASRVPQVAYSGAPNGVTGDNDGSPSGAASNWEAVNEAPSDGGTTYTTVTTPGKQGFTFANLPGNAQPPNLAWLHGVIGDPDAGSQTVVGWLDDGTTEDVSPAIPISPSFTAKDLTSKLALTPSGGAWSKAAFDGLTGGIDVS